MCEARVGTARGATSTCVDVARTGPTLQAKCSSLDEVAEDALEVGVERTHLEQPNAPVTRDGRERARKLARIRRVELERLLIVDPRADCLPQLEQRAAELTRPIGSHPNP